MLFKNTTQKQINAAIAILRVVVFLIVAIIAAVFGFAGVAGAFGQMGIPAANIMGPFVALVELLGGIALVIGLLTRLASLGLAFNMLVAILVVHLKNGFFMPNGYEFALTLMAAAATLTLTGAGEYSIDAIIGRRTNRDDRMAAKTTRLAA